MAHIADLMGEGDSSVGMNNYIARELSPSPVQQEPIFPDLPAPRSEEKEKFVWRMHQPTESRKYQLFPSKKKSQEDMLLSGNSDKASSILGTSVGGRLKEATLVRRRKVSVTELAASMTTNLHTVQELPMDSPTIPGRPALHERSTSAPGNEWRINPFGESIISCISGPAPDEIAEMILDNSAQESNPGVQLSRTFTPAPPRLPLSPKTLAPLVIPQSNSRANAQEMSARSRSESIPPNVLPKSARMRDGSSPFPRASPYTPASASTAPTSVSNTPNSAFPLLLEGRTSSPSPQPWNSTNLSDPQFRTLSPLPTSSPAKGHSRNQSDVDSLRTSFLPRTPSHRRHESESAASIMDRGRPKKPREISISANSSPVKATTKQSQANPNPTSTSPSRDTSVAREAPKDPALVAARAQAQAQAQAQAEAQNAFEHLPTGTRPHLAPNHLPLSELTLLKKQAMGQASRFQVLPTIAVDALSRELRALDERCEYLRKTHRSLRSGRRNLHQRICNYLRGERTAVFSRESLLRQEEALSELDNSIDDWVAKLEQAENRRTRIRQKLLEHVAAALIIPQPPQAQASVSSVIVNASPVVRAPSPVVSGSQVKAHVVTMASTTMPVQTRGTTDPNTPPRSPTKGQSPERLARVVEEIKSSSPEPKQVPRKVESIRIYAESDVYALLADVEEEIERMGVEVGAIPAPPVAAIPIPALEELGSRVFQRVVVEKKAEVKKEEVLSPGIRLHAVAFEGMMKHKKSVGMMRA